MEMARLSSILFPLDEPTSRLYHLNLVMALVMATGWAIYYFSSRYGRIRKWLKIFKILFFNPRYWFHKSAWQDYGLFLFNGLVKALIFVPMLDVSFWVSQHILSWIRLIKPDDYVLSANATSVLIFSLIVFVWDDLLRFFHHFMMHKLSWLWLFHKTHHSAQVLTPITLFRTHPIESLQAVLRNGVSLGVASGAFVALFEAPLTVWTILGVNGFGFILNLFGGTLRHSHIPISFGALEWFLISPKQHQIHHSNNPKYYDTNFGVNLSIWDRVTRSLILSKEVSKIRYGQKV